MEVSDNPFYFKSLSVDDPFCDREKELAELVSYAKGRANVVLFSPRRFGKTSLVKRVQKRLADEGAITVFTDLFGVTSIDDVASRIARAVFEITKPRESFFKRSGVDVLEDTMLSIGEFIASSESPVHIVMDEFQEIETLADSTQIEGIMRTHIQNYHASCFFVGSRRRVLLSIFNDRRRPFFQSAINYELKALPHDDLVKFISGLFEGSGKKCSLKTAAMISNTVSQHPYYSQKLAFFTYENSGKEVLEENVKEAYLTLQESEKPIFEAIVQGLAPQQIALLRAIATEESQSIFSMAYLKRHNLGSTGGVQGATKKLTSLDLIEQNSEKQWTVVDPVFKKWLQQQG